MDETSLLKLATSVINCSDIKGIPDKSTIYWIEDIQHAIVIFSNGEIFNCNESYNVKFDFGESNPFPIEASFAEYQTYWESKDCPIIENDQNCLLWCLFYVHFIENILDANFHKFVEYLGNNKLQKLENFIVDNL